MEKTQFAGITQLAPAEPLSLDGWAFQGRDRAIIDRLLKIGATLHRHDAHAPLVMPNPAASPVVTVLDVGGTIPAGRTFHVGYTFVDADGGETVLNAEPTLVGTAAGLADPDVTPILDLDHAAGTLLAGNYVYRVSVTDGTGGETVPSPPASITVDPGFPNTRIIISGLQAVVAASGGVGWRLWRQVDGGQIALVAEGIADTVTDNGTLCPDCTVQPKATTGTTKATNRLQVNLSAIAVPNGATAVRLYMSPDGSFDSPAFMAEYLVANLAGVKEFTTFAPLPGEPPVVSTSLPGAPKIPDTDISGLQWKRPVANAAALPNAAGGAANGDVRMTLNDGKLHAYYADAWHDVGGGGGHVVVNPAAAAMPPEPNLQFKGSVAVTDDAPNGRTVVDILAGALAPLALGQAVEWRDIDGVTVMRLHATQAVMQQPGGEFADFTVAPLVAPGGWNLDSFEVDLDAGPLATPLLVPKATASAVDDFYARGNAVGKDVHVEAAYVVRTADWSRIGVALGVNGYEAYFTNTELRITWNEATVIVAATPVGWVPPAINDSGTLTLEKAGRHITLTDSRDGGLTLTVQADIDPANPDLPSSLPAAVMGRTVSPATQPFGFKSLLVIPLKVVTELRAETGFQSQVLWDDRPHTYNIGPGQAVPTQPGWDGVAYAVREADGSVRLEGKLTKTGVAPVQGETIVKLKADGIRPGRSQTFPVVTGDTAGKQVGIAEVYYGGESELKWYAGAATVNNSYVTLDGIRYGGY